MYQFEYKLDDKDFLEFNMQHLSKDPASKKGVLGLRLLLPVGLVVLLLFSLIRSEDFDISLFIAQVISYTVISVAWFFLVKPLNMFLIKKQVKSTKKYGKLPYGENVSIRFEDDLIVEATSEAETKVKYASIENIVYGESAIYIYINSMQAFIVPHSVFQSTHQQEDFSHFLHSKWKPDPVKQK